MGAGGVAGVEVAPALIEAGIVVGEKEGFEGLLERAMEIGEKMGAGGESPGAGVAGVAGSQCDPYQQYRSGFLFGKRTQVCAYRGKLFMRRRCRTTRKDT